MSSSSIKPALDLESRRDTRAPVLAKVALSHQGHAVGCHHVVNLSGGGVLLAGTLSLPVASQVTVSLRLPWTAPITIDAELIRTADVSNQHDDPTFALSFLTLSPHDGDVIHSAVVHLLRKARAARVLVVSQQELEICHSFALAIEDLGCPAIVVAAPSEAERLLQDATTIRVVLLDDQVSGFGAGDFFARLARQHPRIRRVLLAQALPTDDTTVAPSSPIGVHAVLPRPCTAAALAAALAVPVASRIKVPWV